MAEPANAPAGHHPNLPILALALGIAMFGAETLGLGSARDQHPHIIYWIANGIPLAVLLRTSPAQWLPIALCAFLGDTIAFHWVLDLPIKRALFAGLMNLLQYGGMALFLHRRLGAYFDLLDIRHMVWLAATAATVTIVASGLVAGIILLGGFGPGLGATARIYALHPLMWLLCHFLGLFVFALPLLAISAPSGDPRFHLDRTAIALLAGLIFLAIAIYGPAAFIGVYLLLPPLMLLGWRYGLLGAGIGALLNNTLGVILSATTQGITQRQITAGYEPVAVGAFEELFFVVGILVSLPIAVARARQLSTDAALKLAMLELAGSLSATRQLEERWHTALEGAGLGVWEANLATGAIFYSRRWKAIRGLADLDDAAITPDRSWVHPADIDAVAPRMTAFLSGKADSFESEYRARCADGGYKWVMERGSILARDEAGAPIRLVGTLFDIDEQKRAFILAERRSRLFASIAAANLAISHRDSMQSLADRVCGILVREGNIALAWLGLPDADGRRIIACASAGKDDAQHYLEGLDITTSASDEHGLGPTGTAFRTNQPVWIDDFQTDPRSAPWQRKSAPFGWRGSAALPIRQRGAPRAVITLYTHEEGFFDHETRSLLLNLASQIELALDALDAEVSASRYRDDLQRSDQRFRAMFEASPLGIAIKEEKTGRYLDANPRFLEIVGWNREQLLGMDRGALDKGEDVAARADPPAPAGTPPALSVEKHLTTPEGTPRWVNMTLTPFATPGQEQGNHLVMIEDITERKALQQQLHLAQRMEAVGQLTGGIAHDFNNLLTVVMGNSEVLHDELTDPELKELAGLILHTSERARELTGRLLAFARQQVLLPRDFDPGELLGKAEGLIRRSIGAHFTFSITTPADLWAAHADPGLTESAILNLCLNARDAMPEGGQLTIAGANVRIDHDTARKHPDARAGDYVQIRVSDSGTGMSPDVTTRIFEPFFTTKPPGRGTGLGLSMVYGFVTQSGGFVDVETREGKGTVFSIHLPAAAGAVIEAAPASGTAPPPRGRERVLLVEDNTSVRGHVRRQLDSLGYQVLEAADGPAALAIVRARDDIDLLFTDVMMPGGMNGRQLAEATAALRPHLPVLFTSGYPSDTLSRQGRLIADVALLAKPYTKRELAEKLRQVIEPAASGTPGTVEQSR